MFVNNVYPKGMQRRRHGHEQIVFGFFDWQILILSSYIQ
jgi:hypothetical protein